MILPNELIALSMLIIWFVTGRGVNLCLLILTYYCLYCLSELILFNSTTYQVFHFTQVIIDTFVILTACLLSFRYMNVRLIFIAYALFVFSSLILDLLMVFDETYQSHVIYKLHEFRQYLSQPVELVFAIIGSGLSERIRSVPLYFCSWSGYNKRNSHKNINQGKAK